MLALSTETTEHKSPELMVELFSDYFQKHFQTQNSYLQQFSNLDKERNQPSALLNYTLLSSLMFSLMIFTYLV